MQPNAVGTEQILTLAEVNEIQEALRKGCGGMVVVPLKDGRRLTPHLVPAKRNGELNRKALDLLAGRLRAIGCQAAFGVGVRGRMRDILAEQASVATSDFKAEARYLRGSSAEGCVISGLNRA